MRKVRRGYFEDLTAVIALGYGHADAVAVADHVHWAADVVSRVGAVGFQGTDGLLAKKLHCVGYLIELVYELMLAPRLDVSSNPGFEGCLGIFGTA